MHRAWQTLAWVLALSCLAAAAAQAQPSDAAGAQTKTNKPVTHDQTQANPEVRVDGVWQAPSGLKQIPIWPNGAPDMEGVSQPAESHNGWSAFDVTTPTMTVFPPKGKNTGAAIIVFPGGGFRAVVITRGGTEICDWISSKGITCVLSKYRVPKSNHHYDKECDCHVTPKIPRALQDAQRTIKFVRSRAKELNLDPAKIGAMGFSAGGYLVVQTSNIFEPTYKPVDAIDKLSSRPDFAIAFYPGHICRSGAKLDPGLHVTEKTPPTFLLQAWDDPVNKICNSTLYARALNDAGVPSEVHLFAKGGHSFGLKPSELRVVKSWPPLVEGWLREIGVLQQ